MTSSNKTLDTNHAAENASRDEPRFTPSMTLERDRLADVHQKIGVLTRQLHDSLSELGHTEKLKASVGEIPDVKNRLAYVAKLTGEAAEKVLNLVDEAKGTNDAMAAMVKAQAPAIATAFDGHHQALSGQLMSIMMAQDFHDLTGQVIARVLTLTTTLETHLIDLLIKTSPTGKVEFVPPVVPASQLIGPAVGAENDPTVASDQSQVDDLLASLGF